MSGLSCSKQALDCMGSVVEMCGISCSSACGILALQPKIEPAFSALEGRFLTTGPLEKSREAFFFFLNIHIHVSGLVVQTTFFKAQLHLKK